MGSEPQIYVLGAIGGQLVKINRRIVPKSAVASCLILVKGKEMKGRIVDCNKQRETNRKTIHVLLPKICYNIWIFFFKLTSLK